MTNLSPIQFAVLLPYVDNMDCLKIQINTRCKSVIWKRMKESGDSYEETVDNIVMEVLTLKQTTVKGVY